LSHRVDHVSVMRIGLLTRSLVALLMLAVASVWQAAPAFAAPPCQMNAGAPISDHVQAAEHCNALASACLSATICCQVAPNLLAPQTVKFSPVNWDRIIYSGDAQTLDGLRLKPDLHPPTILA
jgi:hypothetical protein